MKRIENKIALNYLLVIAGSILINGLISIWGKESFFSLSALLSTLLNALFYLSIICMGRVQYPKIDGTFILGIAVIAVLIMSNEAANNPESILWHKFEDEGVGRIQVVTNGLYSFMVCWISSKQSIKFSEEKSEEDKQKIEAIVRSEVQKEFNRCKEAETKEDSRETKPISTDKFQEEFNRCKEEILEEVKRQILQEMKILEDTSSNNDRYIVNLKKHD